MRYWRLCRQDDPRLDIDFGALRKPNERKPESLAKGALWCASGSRFVSVLVFIVYFIELAFRLEYLVYRQNALLLGINEALELLQRLASLAQLACLGWWGRLNRRRGVFYTFHWNNGCWPAVRRLWGALFCPPGSSLGGDRV
jgi:hypothetical protein